MKKHLPLILLLIFALVGFVDSNLIHLKEIAAKTDPDAFKSCSLNSVLNCASVANSVYSRMFGIPVSLIGIWFYEFAIAIGLAFLLRLPQDRFLLGILTVGVIGALLFSFFLLFMSYFGIGSLCIYCLISNVSTLGVTISWLWFAVPKLRGKE